MWGCRGLPRDAIRGLEGDRKPAPRARDREGQAVGGLGPEDPSPPLLAQDLEVGVPRGVTQHQGTSGVLEKGLNFALCLGRARVLQKHFFWLCFVERV